MGEGWMLNCRFESPPWFELTVLLHRMVGRLSCVVLIGLLNRLLGSPAWFELTLSPTWCLAKAPLVPGCSKVNWRLILHLYKRMHVHIFKFWLTLQVKSCMDYLQLSVGFPQNTFLPWTFSHNICTAERWKSKATLSLIWHRWYRRQCQY